MILVRTSVTGSRLAAVEEAHDLRIAVQLEEVVLVRHGEPTQGQAIGRVENPHPGTLPLIPQPPDGRRSLLR